MAGEKKRNASSEYQRTGKIPNGRKPDVVLGPFNGIKHGQILPLIWTYYKVYGGALSEVKI